MRHIPKAKPTSPTRLTNIAFIADLLAWIRVCQKPIKRKDAKPIPSQPKNINTKLSAVTRTSIKAVKRDKYDIKRPWCGSPFIYSVEYKWTKEETPETTINITVDNASKQKPQLTTKSSEVNHGAKKISQFEFRITVSKKANKERIKLKKIAKVDKIQDPLIPIKRPKQMQEKKLKKGNTNMQKYIKTKNFVKSHVRLIKRNKGLTDWL